MNSRGARWLSYVTPQQLPDVIELAVDTARLIAERRFSIVIYRDPGDGSGNITLPPQDVRIEAVQNIRGAGEQRDAMVSASKQYVVVIGIIGHPTIPNTNIQRDDTFLYQRRFYKVVEFIDTLPGRLMVSCELTP